MITDDELKPWFHRLRMLSNSQLEFLQYAITQIQKDRKDKIKNEKRNES